MPANRCHALEFWSSTITVCVAYDSRSVAGQLICKTVLIGTYHLQHTVGMYVCVGTCFSW